MYYIQSIEQTCVSSPSQWDGRTTTNQDFYIRYRHGILTLRIGSPTIDWDTPPIVDITLGDEYAGFITLEDALSHMSHILARHPKRIAELARAYRQAHKQEEDAYRSSLKKALMSTLTKEWAMDTMIIALIHQGIDVTPIVTPQQLQDIIRRNIPQ